MSPEALHATADAVLFLHFGVVAFNLFWMGAVPVGAWRGWHFVRNIWWRGAHLASLVVVALQAAFGRLCFLTIWENNLEQVSGARAADGSFLERLATKAVFWPLPGYMFVILYIAAVIYALALWIAVPPRRARRVFSV